MAKHSINKRKNTGRASLHTNIAGKGAFAKGNAVFIKGNGTTAKRNGATGAALHANPKKKLWVIIIAAIVVLFIAFFALRLAGCLGGNVLKDQEITVSVESGMNSQQIGELLENSQVIPSAGSFTRKVKSRGDGQSLKPGVYVFTGGQDINSIIDTLVDGDQGISVLIPEGYRLKDIAKVLQKKCNISSKEFLEEANKASSYADKYSFLKDAGTESLEGFLFPDTYTFASKSSAADVIDRMLQNCAEKLQSVDMSYANSKNLTTYDVVVLASIIEKESRTDSDKADIAQVFYNRLHNNMGLGSDVTTYYAVDKELTEELTKKDLESKSPYNTRNPHITGLPPGGICSPGLKAITAAANPSQGDYLFFFYSQKKDKTMFFKDQNSFTKAWKKYGE